MTWGIPAGPPLEPVPTVADLVSRGLATAGIDKKGTYWHISPEGQRLIYDAMERNAEIARNARGSEPNADTGTDRQPRA